MPAAKQRPKMISGKQEPKRKKPAGSGANAQKPSDKSSNVRYAGDRSEEKLTVREFVERTRRLLALERNEEVEEVAAAIKGHSEKVRIERKTCH